MHPSRYSPSVIVPFPPLCSLTGLFLSLIAMAGSSPLHNGADIFPTGDPPPIKNVQTALLPAFRSILGFLDSASGGEVQRAWFVVAGHSLRD